jgi:hypothetical protein
MPGMRPPPPPVSFAPSGFTSNSYGTGTQMAGNVMSGIGGTASMLGAGLGVASMFGKLGGLASVGLDPLAGAMAGFGKFGLMGAGLGAMPAMAIGGLASHTVGSFVGGGQQQQQIGNQLGQFGFQNQGSRTGFGFTRDDAQAIGNQIRSLANIPELMTSMNELTNLIPKLKSSGVMQGVRDATEFNQRFKESVKTIRDVSKMMGSTMDEAAEFFAHSRGVGFLGKQAQLQNVINQQFTSATTGMSSQQFMQMQRAGADMGTQMGISRGRGAKAVTNIAQSLGIGMEEGRISQETLTDVTGLEGPEAIQAAAGQLAGITAQMAKGSAPGRLSMFGLAKFDKSGKYTGMDEDLARRYRSGQIGRQELMRRVQGYTHEQKISASAHAGSMAMDFASKAGPGGIAQFMNDVLADRGYESEGAQSLVMQKMGLSESQVDLFQQMKGLGFGGQDKEQMVKRQAGENAIRERTDPKMIWERIKTKMQAQTFGKVEQMGGEAFTAIGKAWDEWIDDMVGRHVVTMSKEGSQKLARAFASEQGKKDLGEMFSLAAGVQRGGGAKGASTMGKIFGGAGLALSVATGYGAVAGVGALAAGRGNMVEGAGLMMDRFARALGKKGNEWGSTDVTTGRTSAEQFEMMRGEMGITGGSASDAEARMRGQVTALQGLGGGGGTDWGERVRKAQARLDEEGKYRGADSSKKLDMLTEELRSQTEASWKAGGFLPGKHEWNIAEVEEAKKKGLVGKGMDAARVLALKYGGEDMKGALGSAADAAAYLNLSDTAGTLKEKRAALEGAFGDQVAQSIGDKGFGAALAQAISSNEVGASDTLKKGLTSTDPATVLATLKRYNVSPKDHKAFLEAVDKIHAKLNTDPSKGGITKEDALKTINQFRGAVASGDIDVFKQRMLTAAGEVTDTGLQKALMGFGGLGAGGGKVTVEQAEAARDAVTAQLRSVRERARAESDPTKRAKILEGAGAFGAGLGEGLGALTPAEQRMLGKGTQDVSQLASMYGVSEKDITSEVGATAGAATVNINKEQLSKIKDRAASIHATSTAMGGPGATAGESSKELIDTLKLIKKSIDVQTTIAEIGIGNLNAADRAALGSSRTPTGEVPKVNPETGHVALPGEKP